MKPFGGGMHRVRAGQPDMQAIFAAEALLPGGWASDVRIAVDRGRIAGVETAAAPEKSDERHGILLPGP